MCWGENGCPWNTKKKTTNQPTNPQASLGQSNPQLELLQSIKARTQSMQPHEFQMQEQAPNLQGKVLIFYGFFKESVHESAVEQYRVRPVRFLYYLEDDTMEIIEQNEPNSGIS